MRRIFVPLLLAIIIAAIFLSLLIIHSMIGNAKRRAPLAVAPLRIGNIEYRVPNTIETEGFVEAWDMKPTNGPVMLWHKKMYSTLKLPMLLMETDVQLVFITNMVVGPNSNELTIINEKANHYILNFNSRKVRRM